MKPTIDDPRESVLGSSIFPLKSINICLGGDFEPPLIALLFPNVNGLAYRVFGNSSNNDKEFVPCAKEGH